MTTQDIFSHRRYQNCCNGQCCVLSFYLSQLAANCATTTCVFQVSVENSLLNNSHTDSSLYAQASGYVYQPASFTKSAGDALTFTV